MESEPERLAQAMNLLVRYEPMGTTPKACKGFYLYQSRRHVITVNSDLPAALQRIILAHEVAHAVLHREVVKLRAFHDFALYDNSSVYEYEANLFAAEYLLDDDEVMGKLSEDTFFVGVAQELRVPPELLDFKFRILKRKGWQVESPILANSDFLKRITE
jgi:Zn-dependent peptidase ImmA (M78 family)